jgi:hypothetical protein
MVGLGIGDQLMNRDVMTSTRVIQRGLLEILYRCRFIAEKISYIHLQMGDFQARCI